MTTEWSARRARFAAVVVAALTVAACQNQGEFPVEPEVSAAFATGGVGVGGGVGGGQTGAPGQQPGGGAANAPGQVIKNPLPIAVAISPTTAVVSPTGTQIFTATVTNATNTSVTWSKSCGTFVGTGSPVTWTAPGTAGSCTVTATSVADVTKYATATVTVPTFYLDVNGVTIRCPDAAENSTGTVNNVVYTKLARGAITPANAASTCTSGVSDMSSLFANDASFNGDISHWDTRNVVNMSSMFAAASSFNGNIGAWNTSSVTDMSSMFFGATTFNQDIGAWKTDRVTNMPFMFYLAAKFNRSLGTWCVASIPQAPVGFDVGADAWVLSSSRPAWGTTCPNP